MSAARYSIAPGAIALGAATAKTVLMLVAGASERAVINSIHVSIDTSTLLLVELVESTQASNGTTGTTFMASAKQLGGFAAADTTAPAQLTAYHTYTSEPTVLTTLFSWWVNGPGPLVIQYPLGYEPASLVSGSTKYKAIGLRCTSTLASNVRPVIEFESA